jgi:hypothetical protein
MTVLRTIGLALLGAACWIPSVASAEEALFRGYEGGGTIGLVLDYSDDGPEGVGLQVLVGVAEGEIGFGFMLESKLAMREGAVLPTLVGGEGAGCDDDRWFFRVLAEDGQVTVEMAGEDGETETAGGPCGEPLIPEFLALLIPEHVEMAEGDELSYFALTIEFDAEPRVLRCVGTTEEDGVSYLTFEIHDGEQVWATLYQDEAGHVVALETPNGDRIDRVDEDTFEAEVCTKEQFMAAVRGE